MGYIRVSLSICFSALMTGCAHLPSSDATSGAWILDPKATERAIAEKPPKEFGVGWSYVGLLCTLGWVVQRESLYLVHLGPRGARIKFEPVDREGGRYRQTETNPRNVTLRRIGQHLMIQDEDGGLISNQLRWRRIDEDALTSKETRQRSDEECTAAFESIEQRFKSK